MKRKLLVSLLVLSMVLCLLPAGAAADGIVGTEFNTVSAGQTHVSAIDSNGALWTWGCNGAGQLGNGGVIDVKGNYPENGEIYQSMPIKIMDDVVSVSTNKATDLAVGGSVTGAAAAVKSDGSLWVWGRADLIGTGGKGNRENGDGDKQNSSKDYYYQDVPVKIMDDVASVSMGAAYSFALKRDGSLFSWGPCGTPVKIMDDVLSVSAGGNNVAVIKNDNTLWVCVDMPYEDYYDHDTNEYYEIYDPQKIKLEKVMDGVAAVSAGSGDYGLASYQPVFAAIKTDGSLWAWGGLNGYNGGINNRLDDPIKIMDKALSVSVADQIEAVKSDNSLWRFEFSYNGNAKWNEPTSPADWSFKTEKVMDGVSEVSIGPGRYAQVPDFTIVKKTDGSVWAWGKNNNYCVGNGGKGDSTDEYGTPIQKTPVQIIAGGGTTPPVDQPTVIETSGLKPQETGRAYENTQTILVDGKPVTFETYALHDAKGNPTNYIRIRDLAYTINGTKAQFEIAWDGDISLTTGTPYTPNGKEMTTPFSGDRDYKKGESIVTIDGKPYDIQCFVIYGNKGGGYTYYKLRDLGMALGFNVGWNAQDGVFIETDKPYTGK